MKVKLVPKASVEKWSRPPSLKVNLSKPYDPGDLTRYQPMVGTQKQVRYQEISVLSGEDMAEKEWKEALRIIEAYDKMVDKWIALLDKGRKQAARKYEIKLLVARQLALHAMAKADRTWNREISGSHRY